MQLPGKKPSSQTKKGYPVSLGNESYNHLNPDISYLKPQGVALMLGKQKTQE